ncbi:MAG TPA: aminotransferase class I/II-fold pyridoxal phosphate-dependent enzyme [Caldimonas sp.]|nr:aminotransferase class I/II-fold pyridoxal phosphate-dependent enzyme [Caldimonas sp.]HEV7576800.1 aminotransferase class I/II-fold pyridoxal phosphate-dependent enzyme [Caldimonas sp.]
MSTAKPLRFETLAVHAGHSVDPATGAVVDPIHLSTTFERGADGSYPHGYVYSRNHNPNRNGLEAALAALEGGAAAAAFGSGLAAVTAIFQGLQPGDHVVAPRDIYHGTANVLKHLFAKWQVGATFVDMTRLDDVAAALRPTTRIVWIETPSNPLIQCVDIAALADIARRGGARAVADNTFASPALQRPLELGCDMAMHATTKYLGGRSDVLGGAAITRVDDDAFAQVRTAQLYGGAVPSPFDCWLVMRSLPTLPYRMRAHCANAMKVATFLQGHAKVSAVHYPGLPDNPFHAIAKRQMTDFGGMLSFETRAGKEAAMAVAARVELFTRATSLGGVESLIEHRASIEGPESRTPQGLLRVSVGLENADDLIADLAQALDQCP